MSMFMLPVMTLDGHRTIKFEITGRVSVCIWWFIFCSETRTEGRINVVVDIVVVFSFRMFGHPPLLSGGARSTSSS